MKSRIDNWKVKTKGYEMPKVSYPLTIKKYLETHTTHASPTITYVFSYVFSLSILPNITSHLLSVHGPKQDALVPYKKRNA